MQADQLTSRLGLHFSCKKIEQNEEKQEFMQKQLTNDQTCGLRPGK